VADTIPIDKISTEGTQTRAVLNDIVISEYAEAYEQGIELPPIDVYFDETVYWLADGFHRVKAAQKIGRDSLSANVHPGGQRDAIFHAVGANETHGLRRTNADRRHAVGIMLQDPEWSQWSDRDLAERCMVSHTFVNRLRHEMNQAKVEPVKEERRKYQRAGKTQTMRTENIGAGKRQPQVEPRQDIEAGQTTEAPTVNGLQLNTESTATMKPEQQPAFEVASITETAAPAQELSAETTLVTSTNTEPHVLKVIDEAPSSTVSVLSAAAAAELSLEDAWEWATQTDREDFVGNHHDELQKIFRKLEKSGAT
jgi:hypothetical protein